jgi:hypothetical protein
MSSVEHIKSPVEHIQSAWVILAKGAPAAADALVYNAQYAESEAARNQAAMAILDRVGISAKPEVTVRVVPTEYEDRGTIDNGMSPGEIVRKRLLELALATQQEQERQAQEEESMIVDAVLVEEP